jgi:3-deoxy-manno-octulosonate cytidylyltransferase (CMP-KDO synthetase)
MLDKKTLIIIPARLNSTRLPRKPLADICGKSMINRVYDKAIEANIGDVVIACDGDEIACEVKRFGGKFIITDPDLPSGTDRIYQAFKQVDNFNEFTDIINLQGDLPTIDSDLIKHASLALKEGCDIATIASRIKDKSEINNPSVVKIAIAFDNLNEGRALYFSRSAIPYSKEEDADYFHHIGIYAYKVKSLEKFVSLGLGDLEKRESLEQLRALENNMKIAVKIVDSHPLSVDTKEDLEKIRIYQSKIDNRLKY